MKKQMRSPCPVACVLDILGDKWSFLIIRDLRHGARRYADLQNGPEKIPTNILADRLKRLEAEGVLIRAPYQIRPVRHNYALTPKGEALLPILKAMKDWGEAHASPRHYS